MSVIVSSFSVGDCKLPFIWLNYTDFFIFNPHCRSLHSNYLKMPKKCKERLQILLNKILKIFIVAR